MQAIEECQTPEKIAPTQIESPLVCNEHCSMDMDARVYSKDFLLKYSGCNKVDYEIAERMKHLVSPNNKVRLNSSDGAIKKQSPNAEGTRTPLNGSCKISRSGETSSPKSQRENINLLKSSANSWKKSPFVSVSPPTNRRNQDKKPLSPITPNRKNNNQEASIVKKLSYANIAREQPSSPNEPKTPSIGIAEAVSSPSPYKTPLDIKPLDDANSSAKLRSSGRKLPSPLDNHRVNQRHKQIEYGYKTVGYLRYRLLVPKECRTSDQPRTPRKDQACSKRSWDGQLKKWRRELHRWDPEDMKSFQFLLESDVVGAIISRSQELSAIIDDVKRKIIEDPTKALGGEDSDDLSDKENTPTELSLSPEQERSKESENNYENIARALVF